MKEYSKAPKVELSNEEIANLSAAEFKTLVIRMLTEVIGYGHKRVEKVKAMQNEIKENIQGTNSEGKETGTQINDLEQKEEIDIQPEQNEETRIQINEERLRNLLDNFKCSHIQSQGCQKKKRKSKKLKTYLTNNDRELPQSGKGNRLPRNPGSSESQRSWTQGSTHQGTS